MSIQPNPESEFDPLFKPEQDQPSTTTSTSAHSSVEASLVRFWDTVRKSADVIVTLRQENAILNAQNMALHRSEVDLQNRLQDMLSKIESIETFPQIEGQPSGQEELLRLTKELARAKKEITELRRKIDRTEDSVQEESRTESNSVLTDELAQVRLELEQTTEALKRLQAAYSDKQGSLFDAFKTRTTGESSELVGVLSKEEALQMATSLDDLANRIAQLLGIS